MIEPLPLRLVRPTARLSKRAPGVYHRVVALSAQPHPRLTGLSAGRYFGDSVRSDERLRPGYQSRQGPVRHSRFYPQVFKPALRALPPEYAALRWHDLRHTCAALSLAVSPNLAMVQARLGHRDIRTTINIYGHLLPSVEAALAAGLSETFAAAESDAKVVRL